MPRIHHCVRAAGWTGRFIAPRGRSCSWNATGITSCPTGEARLTRGYNLPAKWVIHTVGPIWRGGEHGEDALLANCYRNSLRLAVQTGIKTIAFPAISTGVYRFPLERATAIALRAVQAILEQDASLEQVIFVCYDKRTYETYMEMMREMSL